MQSITLERSAISTNLNSGHLRNGSTVKTENRFHETEIQGGWHELRMLSQSRAPRKVVYTET
jgi:hypothetical protein